MRKLKNQTKKLRIYFNNHYGGKAIINALQFKEMNGLSLNDRKIFYKMQKIIIIIIDLQNHKSFFLRS